ncbi:MAG: putative acylase and diesterase [Chlamydiales bacterium]|jgi:predicted acyl esterase|nr:putative acylase and diesterase [Chlamydiales bacterium]
MSFAKRLQSLFLFFSALFGFPLRAEIAPDVTVSIPMRDGKKMETDIYLPPSKEKKSPCILYRSPKGRVIPEYELQELRQAGFSIAIQEVRPFSLDEGVRFPFESDGWGALQDGFDTVEWLAKSEYSNGMIATNGASAFGIQQLMLAPAAPPSLKCQYIKIASPSLFHYALFHGGQLKKSQVENWLGQFWGSTQVVPYIYQKYEDSTFWQQFDVVHNAHLVKTPAIHYGGWYDIFLQGTLDVFKAWQEKGAEGARGQQKLIVGPWTHLWPLVPSFGDFDLAEAAKSVPVDVSPKSWFEHYLQGKDNGIDRIPSVIYFVMASLDGTASSGNQWRHSDVWPIPAKMTPWYLQADSLSPQQKKETASRSFHYDPSDPSPTIGGRNLYMESGPKDQRAIEERKDVLLFTSDVLTEDLEFTGKLHALIYAMTDQEDTDIAIRLTDVYPDGRSILISEGIRRLHAIPAWKARKKEALEPVPVDIDLWSTSMVIAKGHRLRVSITSSNYPAYEKNLNHLLGHTNGQVAKNTLFSGEKYPSHILLPVIAKDSLEKQKTFPLKG